MKKNQFVIPIEAADIITLANLQQAREYHKSELKKHSKGGHWIHPEDVAHYNAYIQALDILIPYYGG
jgi:hypothetical protein